MSIYERFESAIAACHVASAMPSRVGSVAIEIAQELATNWLVEFEEEIRAAFEPTPHTLTPAGKAHLEGLK